MTPIDALAEKIGAQATYIWPMVIKKVVFDAWVVLALGAAALAVGSIAAVMRWRKGDGGYRDDVPYQLVVAAFGVIAFIGVLMVCDSASTLAWPEAEALRSVLNR